MEQEIERVYELPEDGWYKSCSSESTCAEVNVTREVVGMRDSKIRDELGRVTSPVLFFSHEEWRSFVCGAKNGEFDLPSSPQ